MAARYRGTRRLGDALLVATAFIEHEIEKGIAAGAFRNERVAAKEQQKYPEPMLGIGAGRDRRRQLADQPGKIKLDETLLPVTLEDGIRELPYYGRVDAASAADFARHVQRHWANLAEMPRAYEAETESEFINPILDLLGWEYLPQQEPGRGRRDVADALLFLDADSKARARPFASVDRFRLGAVVVENEARDTRLDRAGSGGEAPSSQLLRYLSRAEVQSGGRLRWGLLTNGRFGRLYWAQARKYRVNSLPRIMPLSASLRAPDGNPSPSCPAGSGLRLASHLSSHRATAAGQFDPFRASPIQDHAVAVDRSQQVALFVMSGRRNRRATASANSSTSDERSFASVAKSRMISACRLALTAP